MSILQRIKQMFGSDASSPELVVRDTMSGLYKLNVAACLTASDRWKPSLTMTTFRTECIRRLQYLRGSMQADMLEVLRRRFPHTYQDIEHEQVNVRLYAKIIEDRAKTFIGSRYHLVGHDGSVAPPDSQSAKVFQKMLDSGNFEAVFRDADRQIHAIHRLAVVLRYDRSKQCVRPMVWPQHLVHWVPDPDLYYSPDAALGVLLEVASDRGINDIDSARYEVWATIDGEDGAKGIHYYTGRSADKYYDQPVSGNESRENPYVDPRSGRPMYPIVWWQADNEPSLYWLPDEDALTIPRLLNSALTDINWGMHYGQHPIISWETQAGAENAVPPPRTEVGPGRAITVAGLHPRFTHPGYDPRPAMDLWGTLADLEAKIGGGVPVSVFKESGAPESGYALRIRNLPLEEHRAEMISVLRHHVEETLYRACVVWNAYNQDKIDLSQYSPSWVPGSPKPPEDESTAATTHAAMVEAGIESKIEWRMAVMGESEDEARRAIEKIEQEKGRNERPDNLQLSALSFGGQEEPEE